MPNKAVAKAETSEEKKKTEEEAKKPAAAAEPAKKAAEPAKKVAEPAKKEEPKKEEPKKEEPKKEEEKKDPEKKAEEPIKTKQPSVLCKLGSVAQCCLSPVVSNIKLVYKKVMSLPWERITNMIMNYGTEFLSGYMYFFLTEDYASFLMPFFGFVMPMVTERFLMPKIGKANHHVVKQLCQFASLSSQYYIYKTNISQAYY